MPHKKWTIINKKGEVVGSASSKDGARRVRDRQDAKYGGVEHSIRAPKTPAPWAKEGPGGRDFTQEDAAARLAHKSTNPDLPRVKHSATLSDKAKEVRAAKHQAGPGLPFRAGDPGRAAADRARLDYDRSKANAWAAQEKADIESGVKKAPLTSKEKAMATEYKPLKTALVREVESGRNRSNLATSIRNRRANQRNTLFPGEAEPIASRLQSAAETSEAQQFVGKMKPGVAARTAAHSMDDFVNRMETHRDRAYENEFHKPGDTWGHTNKYVKDVGPAKDLGENKPSWRKDTSAKQPNIKQQQISHGELLMYKPRGPSKEIYLGAKDLGEKSPGLTKLKAKWRRDNVELAREINPAWNKAHAPTGDAAFKNPEGVAQRTQQHNLQSREFPKIKGGGVIGEGRKDLGRAVTSTIRREASTPGSEGSLAKLAKSRAAAGRSIAGPDAPSVPKNRSILKRGSKLGGKLGGKLGMYGAIKGVLEGAATLRKLKSGAYDLTPEGTAKPKKGYTES